MIDGQTRRKKCNIAHLEPKDKVLKLKKNASNKEVCSALKKEKIECKEKTDKKKPKATEKKPVKSTKKPKPAKK